MTVSNTSYTYRLRVRRLKHAITVCFACFLVTAAGMTGYAFANSRLFDLAQIRITGNETVSREELIALSGLRIGTNLLKVSREQVAANIRSHPYIKRAEISRNFPDMVEIKVSERAPMVLAGAGERWVLLDENGYCLGEAGSSAAQRWALPSICCNQEAISVQPGELSADEGVRAALTLIQRLDPVFLASIREFDAPSEDKLAIINSDGLRIYFGGPENLDRKIQYYEELLLKNAGQCNADTLEYVDLRYDTQITVKRLSYGLK